MSNIYLRLPSFVCAYARNRYKEPLSPNEPVKYSVYEEAYHVLADNLDNERSITYRSNDIPPCFTETEWHNMLCGRHPSGGKVIVKRNPDIYLSYAEISELTGCPVSVKSANFDYLCIQIPQTVFHSCKYFRTNGSWKLRRDGVAMLTHLIRERMLMDMRRWEIETRVHCMWYTIDDDEVLEQKAVNMWERFLMHYDIPITSNADRETFKKMCQRLSSACDGMVRKVTKEDILFHDSADKVVHI